MKLRTDFATNSSSSSFILAQKGAFSEVQKEVILKYVMDNMLGDVILSPESSEEEILKAVKENYIRDDDEQAASWHISRNFWTLVLWDTVNTVSPACVWKLVWSATRMGSTPAHPT